MGYAQRQAQTVELTLNTSFVLSKCGQMIEQKKSISDLLVTSLNTDMNVSENLSVDRNVLSVSLGPCVNFIDRADGIQA